jgi:hypothetical protein
LNANNTAKRGAGKLNGDLQSHPKSWITTSINRSRKLKSNVCDYDYYPVKCYLHAKGKVHVFKEKNARDRWSQSIDRKTLTATTGKKKKWNSMNTSVHFTIRWLLLFSAFFTLVAGGSIYCIAWSIRTIVACRSRYYRTISTLVERQPSFAIVSRTEIGAEKKTGRCSATIHADRSFYYSPAIRETIGETGQNGILKREQPDAGIKRHLEQWSYGKACWAAAEKTLSFACDGWRGV